MNDFINTYGQEQDPETMQEPGMAPESELPDIQGDGSETSVSGDGTDMQETPDEEVAAQGEDGDAGDNADDVEQPPGEGPPPDEDKTQKKAPRKSRGRAAAKKEAGEDEDAASEPADEASPGENEEAAQTEEATATGEDESVDGPASDPPEVVPSEGRQEMSREERNRLNAERRRERMRVQRQNAVLDESGRPIMDGDGTFEDEIAEIYRVKNTRQIVSGYIDEVKQGRGNSESYIESMYNGFRVLIPFSEMDVEIEHREEETERDYQNRLFTTISNMLGAEIDFVVRDVSMEDRLAAGSRLQATKARRRDILNATDRDGQYIVYEGRRCTARVLATHPTFAFLEVYGLRVRLRARDIRSEYVSDVTRELQAGESVTVYVTHMERDKRGEVTEMFVSMRNDEAERRELERAAADLHVGDTCRGRVSSRSRKVIFIRLNNGVHAFCHVSNGLQGRSIPNVGDTVAVRIIRKMTNNSSGNPLMQGKIVRNLKFIAK